jgi:hypothetical protein
MNQHHPDEGATPPPGAAQSSDRIDIDEKERLVYALGVRFAPHVQAAAAVVREAEQHLAEAREALARAQAEAAGREYQSDRLVFMRKSVADEVEGLTRKTTPKKVRIAYRYLLSRAVELAEGEVQGYLSDEAAAQHQREQSVEACLEAERRAEDRLAAARAMQGRVQAAEESARRGLAVMVDKLGVPREAQASG